MKIPSSKRAGDEGFPIGAADKKQVEISAKDKSAKTFKIGDLPKW
jgi:hypothetical protein